MILIAIVKRAFFMGTQWSFSNIFTVYNKDWTWIEHGFTVCAYFDTFSLFVSDSALCVANIISPAMTQDTGTTNLKIVLVHYLPRDFWCFFVFFFFFFLFWEWHCIQKMLQQMSCLNIHLFNVTLFPVAELK